MTGQGLSERITELVLEYLDVHEIDDKLEINIEQWYEAISATVAPGLELMYLMGRSKNMDREGFIVFANNIFAHFKKTLLTEELLKHHDLDK